MAETRPNRRRSPKRAPRGSPGFWSLVAIALLLAAYLAVLEYSRPHVQGDELRLDTFSTLARQGRIQNARILDSDAIVEGTYLKGASSRSPGDSGALEGDSMGGPLATPPAGAGARSRGGRPTRYYLRYFKSEGLRETLANTLLRNRIPTTVDQQFSKALVLPATILLPALILVVVMLYLIFSYRKGSGLFSVRSGARRAADDDAPVAFDQVAGQDAAVTELREVSQFLAEPDRFTALGAQVPKGILLYGPPGCGKTLLARALAGEAGAAFYSISGSDFVELYVGVGASRVRELFREARENAPAIVFVDELDAVGRRRRAGGTSVSSAEEQEQALNQILTEMDGFSPLQGIVVVGATNRPDVLDPALLRPGRFDRAIGLEHPDESGRLAILQVHARGKALSEDVDLGAIAEQAIGMTGADLAGVLNEAGLLAGRAGRQTIGQPDLEQALQRTVEAPERQRRLSMRERSLGQRALGEERVVFADVAGADEAIEELREVKHYLGDPERFARMGARAPRGYLLSGPPGCGKTLLARAVAGESNATFLSVAGTEFAEVFVGEGPARVRDLFAQARGLAPAIVFIDEIDSIGAARAQSGDGHREREQTLNQLLIELDGFGARSGVIVMAATNRPDILDPALVRPGRFDRTIALELPDRSARRAILAVHARGKPLSAAVDLDAVARLTRGLSGADLANVMNEAALLAARRDADTVTPALVEEAIDRAGFGIGGGRRMSDAERRVVAYHEAGHGLVARALPGGQILHKLTIVSRGRALGAAWLPGADEDGLLHSRSLLMERMATLLGGRVAEELVFGEPGDGAADDIARVTRLARRMVAELGMSPAVGALSYADNGAGPEGRQYSEETARLIDSEARRLVKEAWEMAGRVLGSSRDQLDRVAAALLERETLSLEEVEQIAGSPAVGRPAGAR